MKKIKAYFGIFTVFWLRIRSPFDRFEFGFRRSGPPVERKIVDEIFFDRDERRNFFDFSFLRLVRVLFFGNSKCQFLQIRRFFGFFSLLFAPRDKFLSLRFFWAPTAAQRICHCILAFNCAILYLYLSIKEIKTKIKIKFRLSFLGHFRNFRNSHDFRDFQNFGNFRDFRDFRNFRDRTAALPPPNPGSVSKRPNFSYTLSHLRGLVDHAI